MAATTAPHTPLMQDEAQATIIWWLARGLVFMLLVAAAGWLTAVRLGNRPQPAPVDFLVDRSTGERIAAAQEIIQANSVPEIAIRRDVKQFIKNAFTISSDWPETLGLENAAFAVTAKGEVHDKLAAFYIADNPLNASTDGWREVPTDQIIVLQAADPEASGIHHYNVHFSTIWHKKTDTQTTEATPWWASLDALPASNPNLGTVITMLDFGKTGK